MTERVMFYYDGFNFYNSLKERGLQKYYWIDIVAYSQKHLYENDELLKVKYFTSTPLGLGKSKRQESLFKANCYINGSKFETILGTQAKRDKFCEGKRGYCNGYSIETTEEKKTDINIAITIIDDFYNDACDKAFLITGDSDQIPTLKYLKDKFPHKKVIIMLPLRQNFEDFKKIGLSMRIMSDNKYNKYFDETIMDFTVTDTKGNKAYIPREWEQYH